MSEKPGISFVIAAYNLGDSLVRSVRSIQEQSLDQIEILIVNDKSTDNTLDIATELCLSDPKKRTRCISHTRNLGLSSVRNTGLFAAQMKYIWHIDGDDFLPGEHVASQLLQSLEDLGLLAVKFPVFKLTTDNNFSPSRYHEDDSCRYSCKSVPTASIDKQFGFGSAFSIVYSKNFALSLHVFSLESVNIGEDQILNAQLLKSLPCIGLVNIPMYVYDKTGESMMRKSWVLSEYLEERIYIHFLIRKFRHFSYRLLPVAQQRCNYLFKTLFNRAKSDLSHCEFSLLKACWSLDLNLLRESSDFKKNYTPKIQTFLDQSLKLNETNDFSSSFDFIFNETEFVIHCGAHKTATTYMQAFLNNNRYELALHGIIYFDYHQFRNKILKGLRNNSLDKSSIQSSLVELCLPLLFRKPKKVIIFDEELVPPGKDFWAQNPTLSHTFACSKEGYNFHLLKKLIPALLGHRISLIYCIRDLESYIVSRYCEQIKWAHFLPFEEYIKSLFLEKNSVSWGFVCEQLRELCQSFGLQEPTIVAFEQIKNDFTSFLKYLVHVSSVDSFSPLKGCDLDLPDLFFRSSPSTEAIELAFQVMSKNGTKYAQKLYKKLVTDGFGESKFSPLMQEKYAELRLLLDSIYKSNLASLVTYRPHSFFGEPTPSLPSDLHSFESLSNSLSLYEINLNSLVDTPSDDPCPLPSNSLFQGFRCFDTYSNIEGDESFRFARLHFGLKRKQGISAMLRVKNEEDNIRSVLISCLPVFDEIVVIDNGSNDNTLAIISILRGISSSHSEKIKVFSYPFEVARCGQENYDCPENSIHSLAYYYNYCLSLCSFSHIFKWDGDMILPNHMVDSFLLFKQRVFEESSFSTPSSTVCGIPSAITVFKGHNGRYYYKKDELEAEPRLFENRSDVRFVKDILWERLFFPQPASLIYSDQPVFVELKDVGQDEFSHWKIGGLGMGPRKRRELENLKQISLLTADSRDPVDEDLRGYGFEEYMKPIA